GPMRKANSPLPTSTFTLSSAGRVDVLYDLETFTRRITESQCSDGRRGGSGPDAGAAAPPHPARPPSVLVAAHPPADPRLDEAVDLAVEHRLGVVDLVFGAQVLDHLIRVQHVRAHLIAPRRVTAGAQPVERGLL